MASCRATNYHLQHPNKYIKIKIGKMLVGLRPKPMVTIMRITSHCLVKNLSYKTQWDKTKDEGFFILKELNLDFPTDYLSFI